MEWLKEEFVKLAVELRPIGEGVAEHERAAAKARLSGQPTECRTESGYMAAGEEASELPADPAGLLGVDQSEGPQSGVTRNGMAGDESTTVVSNERDCA